MRNQKGVKMIQIRCTCSIKSTELKFKFEHNTEILEIECLECGYSRLIKLGDVKRDSHE